MKKIAVFGAGGFGREVQMLINQINNSEKKWEFIGFYDDGIAKDTLVNGFPVLGGVKEINEIEDVTNIVFAVGDPKVKSTIINKITNPKMVFPVLIHPNVFIGDYDVNIGEGTIITAGCILTINISLGSHIILNLGCTVGHDTIIGNFSSFMPSVNISGEVKIGNSVYVGTGAKIINSLEIGDRTVVGAGSVVVKSIPANCTAVGVPAKPIIFNKQV